MENDLTANLKGTMMTDHNGETAALIKVVTSEQGFTFDGGMVGIVKTKQEAGEVWVWVPHGIKKMSVRHPQLGVLRDYYFPISIEKARTYEMVLTTGKVQTLVNHSIKKQFVIFNVTPANATIEFNGENLSVDASGYAETSVPFGRYNYRVMHPDYHTSAGVADVLEGGSKVVINANLTPNFGYLDIVASEEYNGASVYVNGVQRGELPLQKIQLRSATYVVRIEKDLYKPYEQSLEVKDGETNHWVLPAMEANFAMIELLSQPKTEIWLNGELKGVEKWTGPLSVGEYRVETKQISHVPATETIRIMDTTARSIQLKLPTPLYSSMEITSSPSRAKVYIDGVDMGETPLILNEVLIGMREVVLEKEGFERQVRNVQVDYGVSSSLRVDLTENSSLPASLSSNAAATSITPMSSLTANENPVPSDGGNVIINTKHSDNYTVYLDGEKKASFQGDRYDLGYLDNKWGKHTLKLKGKNYTGGKSNFLVDSDPYVLDVKTRLLKNLSHTIGSFYLGIGAGVVDLYPDFFTQFNANVGVYVWGVNVEYNLTWDDYAEGFSHDVRLGYGLKVGRDFLITPQVGVGYFTCYDEGKDYYPGEEFERALFDYLFAVRVQYCFTKNLSFAGTFQFAPSMVDYDDSGMSLFNIEFRYTIPFRK